jgi:hypothetical protein
MLGTTAQGQDSNREIFLGGVNQVSTSTQRSGRTLLPLSAVDSS